MPQALAADKKRQVLVLGADVRMMLPIARSLGRRGIAVDVAWCSADDPLCKSRFVRRFHELPEYCQDDDGWKHALLQLIDAEDYDLVIPATEAAVYALQTSRSDFAGRPVYLIDDVAFRTFADKQQTYELAASLDVPIPQTLQLDSQENLSELLGSVELPAVLKPCSSVSDNGQIDKHYVRTAETRDELAAYLAYLFEHGAGVMLQQFCRGEGVGVELLACRGEILTAFQHRRLHETNGHGSTYRESTPVHPELLAAAAKLLQAVNYTGVAMIEFRHDPQTGRWRLLEVNARFWGSLPLAAAAGADFPYFLFQLLVEDKQEFPQRFRAGVRSRNLLNDLRWTWRRLRGKGRSFREEKPGSLGWSVNERSLPRVLADTLRGMLLRDHLDTFSWDDAAPAITEVFGVARVLLQRLGVGRQAGPQTASLKSRSHRDDSLAQPHFE